MQLTEALPIVGALPPKYFTLTVVLTSLPFVAKSNAIIVPGICSANIAVVLSSQEIETFVELVNMQCLYLLAGLVDVGVFVSAEA